MGKIDRAALRQKIQQLEGLTDDERAALLELAATKRYGLVWEEREEDVEERLREELPVLVEDKDLALLDGGKDAPNHILIEGDNLEALTRPTTRATRTSSTTTALWTARTATDTASGSPL